MKTTKLTYLAVLCLAGQVALAATPLRFSNVLGDNMVLQRDQALSVWGWAEPGAEVRILLTQSREEAIAFAGEQALQRKTSKNARKQHSKMGKVRLAYVEEDPQPLSSVTKTELAGKDGKWIVDMGAFDASFTPTYLAATCGEEAVALQNLLIGELWIASGQSNMRYGGRANRWEGYGLLPSAVRYVSLDGRSATPHDDLHGPAVWQIAEDGIAHTFSSIPYFFAKFLHEQLKVPVGVMNISQGGARSIEWCRRNVLEGTASPLISRDLEEYDQKIQEDPASGRKLTGPANLFNARFYPLRHLTVAGVIYLQGETEAFSNGLVTYQKTFPGVIQSYRETLENPDLPFGIISLQGIGASSESGIHAYAIARDIHLQTHKRTPNTGYIVAHDIGGGVHPSYKRPLAERAAYWALRDVYGVMEDATKTRIKGVRFDGRHALIAFEEVELKDGQWVNPKPVWPETTDMDAVAGFMIAGDDQVWYPGDVGGEGHLDQLTTMAISSPMVPKPVAVRYAWEGWSRANLGDFYDPIPPYRSDDWELLPEDKLPEPGTEVAQRIQKYLDSHERDNLKLELPLREGVARSAKNLALSHAHPKGMMMATLTAVEGLMENFDTGTFEEMTPAWSETAMLKIPVWHWSEERMWPARKAKWSWLMERALSFNSFVDDMEGILADPAVKAELKILRSSLARLEESLKKFPEPQKASPEELWERFRPMAEKEKERLEKEGVHLRTLNAEMNRRSF